MLHIFNIFSHEKCLYVILYELAKFDYQTFFTFQDIK